MKEQTLRLLGTYADELLAHSDAENPQWNIEKIRAGKPNKWNYIDGCMITAVLALHQITGKAHYLEFADRFMDFFVQEDSSILTYDREEYNLDNINPAKNLFALYELTHKEKYRRAMDAVRHQLDDMPRTREGSFWHKKIYPNQVWLDGLYMAQPFYMQYETKFQKMRGCMDSFRQFVSARTHLRDEETGLYYHGYDESRSMYWANKDTGCSANFWLRAMGWYTLALTDTLEIMDLQNYYEYRTLLAQLKETVDAILPWQSPNGMFYQVINRGDVQGNYLETSGTALLAYAILKAVRLDFLPHKYRAFAEKAFWGTTQTYLSVDASGKPCLGGICLVAGLGGEAHRDGSVAYYLSEPIVTNEAKGVAPLLLAYTEMMRGQE